ncbi:hypothetical protein DPEC_G00037840 [Dallia pectoralis]|uniref:Uncharacterized protein n=1 Tax=Dallia pectoralis TaxID=75939 RepID=A0ACC2HE66_DALPE|nr:hypothetical protein DPEC_G00037840 [Dallia pectoralis]
MFNECYIGYVLTTGSISEHSAIVVTACRCGMKRQRTPVTPVYDVAPFDGIKGRCMEILTGTIQSERQSKCLLQTTAVECEETRRREHTEKGAHANHT